MSAWERDMKKKVDELEKKVGIIAEIIQPEDFKLHINLREQIAELKEALLKLIEWLDIEDLMFKRELLTKLKGEKEK